MEHDWRYWKSPSEEDKIVYTLASVRRRIPDIAVSHSEQAGTLDLGSGQQRFSRPEPVS